MDAPNSDMAREAELQTLVAEIAATQTPGQSPFNIRGHAYREFLGYVDEHVVGGRTALSGALPSEAFRAFLGQDFEPTGW